MTRTTAGPNVRGTGNMTADLIGRAQAGDEEAFRQLTEPYRRELQVHCYRILGSVQDAEDVLQETMFAAWQGLRAFEQRASIRTWLYQVATNRCLNALRSASRRPQMQPAPELDLPTPSRLGEVVWLEPYPDVLLGLADNALCPEARYEATEAISLAFVTALQLLPPRQRAVVILRDVLGFRAAEVASMLQSSEASVTSALKRARATLKRELPRDDERPGPPPPDSAAERELVARLTEAYDAGDVNRIVALLTEDVRLAMPPVPLEYQGRELAAQFLRAVAFRQGRRYQLVATRANRQPAFGAYVRDPRAGISHANGLLVFTLAGNRISGITRFDNSVLARFGLPRTLAD
jgi:RNA polymerase sigma-70 factor (TIGR02960 family)